MMTAPLARKTSHVASDNQPYARPPMPAAVRPSPYRDMKARDVATFHSAGSLYPCVAKCARKVVSSMP